MNAEEINALQAILKCIKHNTGNDATITMFNDHTHGTAISLNVNLTQEVEE